MDSPGRVLNRWRLAWALAGLGGLAGGLLFAVWTPEGGPENSICLFRRSTGIPCPGCGLTRAFAALAKGEWAAALDLHAFSYLVAAQLAVAWLVVGWWLFLRRRVPPQPPWLTPVFLVQVAAYLAYWTGRLATGTLPW